jgi:molybdopterin/thiamine biosynthesis adenylyltransferase
MNLNKSYEFFKPEMCDGKLHIIGCGSVGSVVSELLIRLGLTNLVLYDFDTVEAHNIANQLFRDKDIGSQKTQALKDILVEINPYAEKDIKTSQQGYKSQPLSGYVFLCLDNIDTRREIVKQSMGNDYIKVMFDFRMRLEDGVHYAADWANKEMVQLFLNSMNYTHEEAVAETPMSACNIPLSVAPAVRMICSAGIANFMNFIKGAGIKKFIEINAFTFDITSFN